MARRLKLGIVGMSEGNGHPYSWSAIFNGYDQEKMERCPFPVIPAYLSKESCPDNFLGEYGKVTHIWTQQTKLSNQIAEAAKIEVVCQDIDEMLANVDAVLLARDDAENHHKFAAPILEAGLPIYIDKPFALSVKEAERLWNKAQYPDQIFTCSALQFAKEFDPNNVNYHELGVIHAIWATIPKSWSKYAVHIIEPTLNLIPNRGDLVKLAKLPIQNEQLKGLQVEWSSGIIAQFQTTGSLPSKLEIQLLGDKSSLSLVFQDTFYAFKTSLKRFVDVVNGTQPNLPIQKTREMVQIIEALNYA